MLSDFRYAFRQLAKSPGFTAVAVLTLALGMGANTTFFSVLHGVVLRSLPYPNSGDLVELRNGGELGRNDGRLSVAELRDYRERQRSLAGIGAYAIGRVTLNSDDGAERVIQVRVTANLLPLLGIAPAMGRNFTEEEERAGADRAIIVSHEFWQTHLSGSPDVLGRIVRLNSAEHTVVGVMPTDFSLGERGTAIWRPFDLTPRGPADRSDRFLSAVARLAPSTRVAQAGDDLDRVARQLQADLPGAYPAGSAWGLDIVPLREAQVGGMRTRLGALMAAAGAVLLIAVVNVAIMFLLRAAVRRREISLRLALGASPLHIIQQSLAESAVICALGTIAGSLLAVAGIELLQAFPPAEIPRLQEVALNAPVAAFSFGVMLLVTLAVGLAPAVSVLRNSGQHTPANTSRSTETRSVVRLRDALTVVEIALAVMLLVCGGLAVRSLQALLRDDVGFATAQLFTFKTNLTDQAYPDLARANRFYEQFMAKIEVLPGVASVAAVSYLPLSGESQFMSAAPANATAAPDTIASLPMVAGRVVRGPYFRTVGSTLLRGRVFNETDQPNATPVAIVDDRFARRFWADESAAIGQLVRFGEGASAQVRTIVGVVRHVKHSGPGKDSLPEAYVPQTQFYQRGMYTVVKTTVPAAQLAPLVRAQLAEVDPGVPMYFMETMERRYATILALPRFTAGLITAFSTLALVLAAVGIFGVTAYSVAQRSREFGIRFALGAQRSHVAGIVLGRVARLALLGGALGATTAYFLAQLMTGLLFGVEPADTPTLVTAATVIALTALAGCAAPLIRALRVNPAEALRAE